MHKNRKKTKHSKTDRTRKKIIAMRQRKTNERERERCVCVCIIWWNAIINKTKRKKKIFFLKFYQFIEIRICDCIKIVQELVGDEISSSSSSSSDCIDGEQLSCCSSWWIVSSSSAFVCCNEEFVVEVVVWVDETDDERRWLIIGLFVWQLLVFVGNKRWNKSIVCCWWNAAATATAVAAALFINWLGFDDVDDWIG